MKPIILLVTQLFCVISLSAQPEVTSSPQAFSNLDIPGYNQQWKNNNNASVSDNNYAIFGDLSGAGSHTDFLVAYDFGFNIPLGTTITGIKLEVECSDPNNRTSDYSIRIMNQGAIVGDEKAGNTAYSSSDAYMTYGGPTDCWGTTWSNKLINDVKFGVAISAQRNTDDAVTTDGQVNSIRVTVYFNYITLPVSLTSFTAKKDGTHVRLAWKTSTESNMDHYEIERSSNGAGFSSITSVPSQNISGADYSYTDNNPLSGISYYRLNMKGLTADQKYSPIVAVSFGRSTTTFLYPSPWEKGAALNISNMNSEKLTIYFMNAGGQTLSTAVTESGVVPTETLVNRKGLIYYKVFDPAKNQIGAGTLLIL